MRVYTVKVLAQVPVSDSTSSTLEDFLGSFPDIETSSVSAIVPFAVNIVKKFYYKDRLSKVRLG